MIDLSKMADLDMGKLPKVEESGKQYIQKIQEFIINELSSLQGAVLLEDKLQRLVVGVRFFLSYVFFIALTFYELEFGIF